MQVKCTLCDKVEHLQDDSFTAKRLRNRRLNLYMCTECHKRIEERTKQRLSTGKFHLYKDKNKHDDLI